MKYLLIYLAITGDVSTFQTFPNADACFSKKEEIELLELSSGYTNPGLLTCVPDSLATSERIVMINEALSKRADRIIKNFKD